MRSANTQAVPEKHPWDVVLLLTTFACIIFCPVAEAQPQAPAHQATFEKDRLIDELCGVYRRIEPLPGLRVHYRVDIEELVDRSKTVQMPAFAWAELEHALRPSEPAKIYIRFKHPPWSGSKGSSKQVVYDDVAAGDGKLFVEIADPLSATTAKGDPKRKATAARLTPISQPPFTVGARFYFLYLGYAGNLDPELGRTERNRYPDGYWLPKGLEAKRQAYQVEPNLEKVDGVACHVLTRSGLDQMWVQTEPAVMLRRRQIHWGDGQGLRQNVVFGDFVELVPQLWLPRSMLVENYAAPWDAKEVVGRAVCRIRLKVSSLSAEALPDGLFRPDIPIGATVADSASSSGKVTTFVNRPGMDPFELAAAELERQAAVTRRRFWLLVGGVILGLGLLAVVGVWFFRKLRERSWRTEHSSGGK